MRHAAAADTHTPRWLPLAYMPRSPANRASTAPARIGFRAAERAHRYGHLDHQATQLIGLASNLAVTGDSDRAALFRGWAESIISVNEGIAGYISGTGAFEALMDLPNRLGEERFAALTKQGATMTDHEILEAAAAASH